MILMTDGAGNVEHDRFAAAGRSAQDRLDSQRDGRPLGRYQYGACRI